MDGHFFIKNEIKMFFGELLRQFGVAKVEKMMLFVIGFVTLVELKTVIGIVIALVAGAVSTYFAIRKHRQREEREKEMHLLAVIRELESIGEFDETMTAKEKRKAAMDYIAEV